MKSESWKKGFEFGKNKPKSTLMKVIKESQNHENPTDFVDGFTYATFNYRRGT